MPPAARISDMHLCPMVTPGVPPIPHVGGPITGPGAPVVLIGNMPAAVVGDVCTCVGPPDTIVKGSAAVLIANKPAARLGDTTAHGGAIVAGCPIVLIGDGGSSGGGGGGGGGDGNGGGPPAAVAQAYSANQPAQIAPVPASQVGPLQPKQTGKEKTWIGILLRDFMSNPLPNHPFQVTLNSGQVLKGTTDAQGYARFENLDPDSGEVAFTQLSEIKDQADAGPKLTASETPKVFDFDTTPITPAPQEEEMPPVELPDDSPRAEEDLE